MSEITIRPVGRASKCGVLYRFMADIGNGQIAPFEVWMAQVTDRRLARRIARKTGKRFSRKGQQFIFRSAPAEKPEP